MPATPPPRIATRTGMTRPPEGMIDSEPCPGNWKGLPRRDGCHVGRRCKASLLRAREARARIIPVCQKPIIVELCLTRAGSALTMLVDPQMQTPGALHAKNHSCRSHHQRPGCPPEPVFCRTGKDRGSRLG